MKKQLVLNREVISVLVDDSTLSQVMGGMMAEAGISDNTLCASANQCVTNTSQPVETVHYAICKTGPMCV